MSSHPSTERQLSYHDLGYDQLVAACMTRDEEIERLHAKLERVERLAAGNLTGCGTCSTILKEFPADVQGEPR